MSGSKSEGNFEEALLNEKQGPTNGAPMGATEPVDEEKQ